MSLPIAGMLENCAGFYEHMPPTTFHNENWLLRVVLEASAKEESSVHPLGFSPNARWYTEGWLRPAFLPEPGGDRIGEGFTHADGTIGHFNVGGERGGEIVLRSEAEQFIVIEGKLGSPLSKGTTNAPGYDQAARNVACMANVIAAGGLAPSDFSSLAFFVIAPRVMIPHHGIDQLVGKDSIRSKVRRRVDMYNGARDAWFANAFEPLLEAITVEALAWEDVLETLSSSVFDYRSFYSRCLQFNGVGPR